MDYQELPAILSRTIDPDDDLVQFLLKPDSRLIIYELPRPAINLNLPKASSSDANGNRHILACGNNTFEIPDDLVNIIQQLTVE